MYRVLNPEWSWEPLSGEGARIHGGRFNRVGLPALYTSLTILCAIRESTDIRRVQPQTICQYEVDADPVFDGTSERELKALGINPVDLSCENWRYETFSGLIPESQKLADRLIVEGFVGLLYPSYSAGSSPTDRNLVLWKYGDKPPSRIVLVDDRNALVGKTE